MNRFTLRHDIACSVDTFWKLFFDRAFNEKQYRDGLRFPYFEVLAQTEDDRKITRRLTAQPQMSMPGPVAKLLGSNFRYVEDGVFDKAAKIWTWNVTPGVLADKVQQKGKMHVEPNGPDRITRIADVEVEARVFGLGGAIESAAAKQIRDGMDAAAAYVNQYVRNLPAS